MSGTPPTEQGNTLRRLQRATTGRLQRWDTRLAREDGTGENGVDSSGMARRIHLARTETRGRLQRHTTQRLPVGADQSESAPPVVIAQKELADQDWRRPLVAPLSGMIAGALEITALWPTEWVKVQRQLRTSTANFNALHEIRKEGLGIYRGLAPMLIGAPLQCAVRFSTLDTCKGWLSGESNPKQVGRGTALVAGMMAGALEAILVVTPMETVKTRLVDSNKGLLAGVAEFYRTEGVRGIHKGLSATIAKSASNQMLRFLIFNEYKNFVVGDNPLHELTPLEALLGGMTAGCLGCLGNTPFDVLKTRMQGLDAKRYSSTMNCLSTTVREDGFFALYRGLSARLCRVVPGQGLIFMSYETISQQVMKALDEDNTLQ